MRPISHALTLCLLCIFWASSPLFVQHFIELGCFSSGMEEYLHRSIELVSEWIFWTGWLRASRCSVRASSPTDVWVSKPAYGSESAVGVHRAARSCLAPGSHCRQNSLTDGAVHNRRNRFPPLGNVYLMAKAGRLSWTVCIIRNWCKEVWTPRGGDGTGKPGVNHHTHQTTTHPIFCNYDHLLLHDPYLSSS